MAIVTLSKHLFSAVVFAPYLLLGGTALAAPPFTEHREPLSALGNLNPASASLPHAIAAIEAKAGGKVMDIQFESDGGQPAYDAVVVAADKVGVARLYVRTGVVSETGADAFSIQSLKWEKRRDVTSFEKATTPLSTAIETVERAAGASAINAGLAKPLTPNNDVLAYNVEIVKDGQVLRVAVDASTGEVIADPGAMGLGDRDPGQFLSESPE